MNKEAITKEHLAEADKHIEEAEARIAGQRGLIAELAADGHDTLKAEELLESFIATLGTMQKHRETILRELHNVIMNKS